MKSNTNDKYFIFSFICLIVMSCCEGVRRKSPGNMVCLGIFTLAEGFMMGIVVSTYSAKEVLIALGICVVVVFGNFFCLRYKFLPLFIFYFMCQVNILNFGSRLNVHLLAQLGNFWFKLPKYRSSLLGKSAMVTNYFVTVLNSFFY